MKNYEDHAVVIKCREAHFEIEKNQRDKARECINAFNIPGGIWDDPYYVKWSTKRPKYNFDVSKKKVLKAYGEIASQEVLVDIKPTSKGSSKEIAMKYKGLYRAVQDRSKAPDIYKTALRRFMISGFDAGMIEQDWLDNDSFDQELFIRQIPDSINRVWFWGNWYSNVAEDAEAVTVDYVVSDDEYKDIAGDDIKPQSLDCDSQEWNAWAVEREGHLISRLFYKKPVKKTIYQLSDGTVLNEEDYEELSKSGLDLGEVQSRERDTFVIYVRYYDAKRWLNEAEETVFDLLPVVPALPNFDIVNNIPISYGKYLDLLDPQRAHNALSSRVIYDAAMSPKPKIWVGKKAVESPAAQLKLKSYNDNDDPVFAHDGIDSPFDAPSSVETSGISPAMSVAVQMARAAIDDASGMSGASDGLSMANQSGDAISLLQKKGDVVDTEYADTLVRFAEQLAKVSIRAMQKLYSGRKVITNESGEPEEIRLDRMIQTPNGMVTVNDLTMGVYNAVCSVVPKTESLRREAADAIERVGQFIPGILERNRDLFLQSVDAPGMDKIASRERAMMVKAGQIPEDELTEQEKQIAAQMAQQPQQPDPMTVLAMATAEAEVNKANAQVQKVQVEAQTAMIKAEQAQQKMDFEQQIQKIQLIDEKQNQMVDMLNKMADILQKLSAVEAPANSASAAFNDTAKAMDELQ